MLVNELGDEFLAAAALAGDEYRRVGGGHSARQLDRLAERRRRAQQGHVTRRGVQNVPHGLLFFRFTTHHEGVRRAPDQHLQVSTGEGLGEIVPGALPQRLDARVDARIAGHHDEESGGVRADRRPQQREAVHL